MVNQAATPAALLSVCVLFGPTASGKSALALNVAAALRTSGVGARIINADSRQLYTRMPLLAACPSAADYAATPHALYEFLSPGEPFSAPTWAALAATEIQAAWAAGQVPLVVGGTGFYLQALLKGLSAVPAVPPEITAAARTLTLAELQAAAQRLDPTWWHLKQNTAEASNPARLARVVAVAQGTGQALSVWQAGPAQPPVQAQWLKVGLNPPGAAVQEKISARWHAALAAGVVAEAQSLPPAPWPQQPITLPVWQALGRGEITPPAAIAAATQLDVHYAKRQRTWLRNQFKPDHLYTQLPNRAAIAATLARRLLASTP